MLHSKQLSCFNASADVCMRGARTVLGQHSGTLARNALSTIQDGDYPRTEDACTLQLPGRWDAFVALRAVPTSTLMPVGVPELRCRLEDLGLFRARPGRGKYRRGLRSIRQILRCGGTGVLSRLPR